MGCYSDKIIATSKKVTMIISIIFGVIGLLTAIVIALQDDTVQKKVSMGKFNLEAMDSSTIKGAALGLAVISLFIACCGVASAKWQKVVIILPYMVCTILIGLIALGLGSIIAGYGGDVAKDGIDKVCEKVGQGEAPTIIDQY